MMPVRFVCGTRVSKEAFLRDTALGRSLAISHEKHRFQILLFPENRAGLSSIYNVAIEQAKDDPALLIFVHDDVCLVDFYWRDKLHDALKVFDVVGLAGNTRRVAKQPGWAFTDARFTWDEPKFLSGVVGHGKGFPCDTISVFGPSGQECKLLDGLLLAAHSSRLNLANVRFDEQFQFHFYDVDFCRQAEAKGLKMGTWPISVVHESGGAFGAPSWLDAYQSYLTKYGE